MEEKQPPTCTVQAENLGRAARLSLALRGGTRISNLHFKKPHTHYSIFTSNMNRQRTILGMGFVTRGAAASELPGLRKPSEIPCLHARLQAALNEGQGAHSSATESSAGSSAPSDGSRNRYAPAVINLIQFPTGHRLVQSSIVQTLSCLQISRASS